MDPAPARCPRCGFERSPQAAECPVCGVVFAKLEHPAANPGLVPYIARPTAASTPDAPFVELTPDGLLWRADELIVLEIGASLPDRCVRCNAPARQRIHRDYYWRSPWHSLFLLGLVVSLRVAPILRHTVAVEVPLCAHHLERRARAVRLSGTLAALGVLALGAGLLLDIDRLALAGLLLSIAGAVTVNLALGLLAPQRIDEQKIWLAGASPAFLDSLPVGPSLL